MLAITNKAQQAYDSILLSIQGGEFASGQILSEAKLAAELNMTRTPVREALSMLANEKLVESVGRATRVRVPQDAEFMEHLLDRFALEMWVVLVLARRNRHEGRMFGQLGSILDEMEKVRKEAEDAKKSTTMDPMLRIFTKLDFDFHCHMATEARRPMIADYLKTYKNIFILYATMRKSPGSLDTMKEVLEEHRAILAAIRCGDGKEAVRQERNHILEAVRRRKMPFYEEIAFELNTLQEFEMLEPGGGKSPSPDRPAAKAYDSRNGKRNK